MPLDPMLVGAIEAVTHVAGSGGRYQCAWCLADAYQSGRVWRLVMTGVEVPVFPHFASCPACTIRQLLDRLGRAELAVAALEREWTVETEREVARGNWQGAGVWQRCRMALAGVLAALRGEGDGH